MKTLQYIQPRIKTYLHQFYQIRNQINKQHSKDEMKILKQFHPGSNTETERFNAEKNERKTNISQKSLKIRKIKRP